MLKDSRESNATSYQVVDAETGNLITDVVAVCDDEGWVLRDTQGAGASWLRAAPNNRHIVLEFRPVRIVSAPPAIPKAVGEPVDLFAQLLTDVTEEIAATCLQPDGTWRSSVVDRLEMIARQHEAMRRNELVSLDLRKCWDGPNVALDHAIEVTAYYDRVVNGIQEGYRGYITTERLLDAQQAGVDSARQVHCLGIVHDVVASVRLRLSAALPGPDWTDQVLQNTRECLQWLVETKRLVGAKVDIAADPSLGLRFELLPDANTTWSRVVTWEEIAHAR